MYAFAMKVKRTYSFNEDIHMIMRLCDGFSNVVEGISAMRRLDALE